MDNKRLFLGITLTLAVILGWQLSVKYLAKRNNWALPGDKPPTTQPTDVSSVTPTTATAANTGSAPTTPTTASTQVATSITTRPLGYHAAPATQPAPSELGSMQAHDPQYAMAVSLSANGAGVNLVTLNEFKQVVDSDERYRFQSPYPAAEDITRPFSTRSITINGTEVSIAGQAWKLQESDSNSATYTLDIADNNSLVLRLRKRFELRPRTHESKGYEVLVETSFENFADGTLDLGTRMAGPTTPPREVTSGPDRQLLAGYNDEGEITIGQHYVEEYDQKKPTIELTKNDKGPLQWAGAASVYFNALFRPDFIEGGLASIKSVESQTLNPDAKPHDRNVAMIIDIAGVKVEPGKTVTLPARAYFGPRKREILNTEYYAGFPLQYDETLRAVGGCSFCAFPFLINALVWMLWLFHSVTRDWGLAIICLVIVVRLILHPITKRSQMQLMKMSKMAPEVERLKKKYGDDKDELNKHMMELYKQQGPAQIMGCLPLFLQMPIWIALWQSLQTTFELRLAPFLQFGRIHLTWIDDLSKPDQLITWRPITLPFGIEFGALNLLPILLAVVFYLQQKFQPQAPASTPEQEQQRKMMQYMSLLFPIFLYNGPSGLNLYILTSTAIGIIESKRIRDHIKQKEEMEKSGKVIVDAKPTRAQRSAKQLPTGEQKKSGSGCMFGWLESLQRKAEEVRRETDRRSGR